MLQFLSRSKKAAAIGLWCSAFGASLAQGSVPSFEQAKARFQGSDVEVLDRHGKVIQVVRRDPRVRQLGWVRLSDISSVMQLAVISAEDHRFYSHSGVDWWALSKAAEEKLMRLSHLSSAKNERGASTISMQVASFLDATLKPLRGHRQWEQKIGQITEARELEKTWSKEQILEAYLNLVSFRGELRGVGAASQGLFGKSPSGLDREESLVLASLIRSPESSPKRILARACELSSVVLGSSEGRDECGRIRQRFDGSSFSVQPFPPAIALAPHAARIALREGSKQLTLDSRIQSLVYESLRRHVLSLRSRNMHDGAAIVLDNQTGDVLAYVGSVGDVSSASEVDGVRARRQAGSSLKPFLYSIAIEKKILTASSLLDDSPTDIPLNDGSVYRPRDFDHEFHGFDVSLRTSLASSLNVPAVRTLKLVGVTAMVDKLKRLGFEDLKTDEFYGPSLALGSADISLWELANAYRALANGGVASEAHLFYPSGSAKRQDWSRQAIDRKAAFIISDILSDSQSRSLTFGLDSPLALSYWAAVKTGTSKDMRDNWCVGYSRRYTVGVWAGNFSGAPMWDISGVSGAGPSWAEIMQALHDPEKDHAPAAPKGLVRVAGEWYLPGTQPNSSQAALAHPATHQLKISYPVEGMWVAYDPDIPPANQKIPFELSSVSQFDSESHSVKWVLNGQEVGKASSKYFWPIGSTGAYELKLVDSSGQTLDQVHFLVR